MNILSLNLLYKYFAEIKEIFVANEIANNSRNPWIRRIKTATIIFPVLKYTPLIASKIENIFTTSIIPVTTPNVRIPPPIKKLKGYE